MATQVHCLHLVLLPGQIEELERRNNNIVEYVGGVVARTIEHPADPKLLGRCFSFAIFNI